MQEIQEDWIDQQESEEEPAKRKSFELGLHENISNEDYHRSAGIGSTGLKRILKSPAHFRYPKPFDSTRHKEIGTAVHCAILEPKRYESQYLTVDCDARTSAAYRAACKEKDSALVLTKPEAQNIAGMQAGVMRNKKTRMLIEAPGRYELSLYTKDPVTGIFVKVRYDKLCDTLGFPIDLKKTQDASRDAFSRAIHNYGYHISAALYADAWEWQFGETLDAMRWIAVEEQTPHAAQRYKPDADAIMIGREKYREALEIYARCLDRDEWPIYDDDEDEEIALPYYALRQEDEMEIDFGGEE